MAARVSKPEKFINYAALEILVADDFSSFRHTIFGMLQRMGVQRVETAGSAEAVLEICQRKRFDIILCDYNLGAHKTGQHVLEELRFKNIISKRCVFIIVSAEAARMIVMSAYDCEPDDYLMKPVTSGMLQQRIDKMLTLRLIFSSVFTALEKKDVTAAIELLIDLSIANNKYAVYAQKWLGEIFLREGQIAQAERLYSKALEHRALDWAKLGLAKCRQQRGDTQSAKQWLEQIIEDNPLLLPAYDALADTLKSRNDFVEQQKVIMQAVDISPMSILRQKKLAKVAKVNNDLATALDASLKTVKLGALSCYGSHQDTLNFARTAIECTKENIDVPANVVTQLENAIKRIEDSEQLEDNFQAQCHALLGNLYLATDQPKKAEPHIEQAKSVFDSSGDNIHAHLDYVNLLISLDNREEVEHYLKFLLQKFKHDQHALQLLDGLLSEPASEHSKEIVASVNKEGIALYENEKFSEAISCFEKALELFPKHVGIQLNILQALVGQMSEARGDETLIKRCNSMLLSMSTSIDSHHTQYDRYQKIRKMALNARDSL